jgi:hypothetical protein
MGAQRRRARAAGRAGSALCWHVVATCLLRVKTASILTGPTAVVTTIVGIRLRERAAQDESRAAGRARVCFERSNGSPEKECS